ncbi:Crp/Fnr family transcriptional regulator [Pseudochryseolinea flava]|uniref:Crp/Fnr family transcriptional regulator n=1 Tax=Pseudochryseolinea flava TaxID=2059302 RepID=A0A364YA13_9BACT|nr:Crp/Fnr family transcriptional regulator [Pseudochryseolinea flava]RAW03189.1 Crp/Fnr family transcriptional regulator [Pseudochryseolinea flava]
MTVRTESTNLLRASISRVIDINDDEWKLVLQYFFPMRLKKREPWFTAGSACNEVAFVVSGCVRTYLMKDGNERSGQFFFENEWYTDYSTWLGKSPTTFGVDAVENAELLLINFRDLERLYKELPKFERFGRIMAESALWGLCIQKIAYMKDSAEAAYLQLLESRPNVIERVPQHMIASYLGIEPETLSRVRRKISQQAQTTTV